jgi:hypothetical protein
VIFLTVAVNAKRLKSFEHCVDQALGRWFNREVFIEEFLELLKIDLDFERRKLVLESSGERLDAFCIELRLEVFYLLVRWKVFHGSFLAAFYDVCSLGCKRCFSTHRVSYF